MIDRVLSSGTGGQMVEISQTESDLVRLAQNEAYSLSCAGFSDSSTIQLMCTIDRCFMAGMAYFLGARQLGASVIRSGSGHSAMQLSLIKRFKPDTLIAVPSSLIRVLELADEQGVSITELGVKKVIAIGEAIRSADGNATELAKQITANCSIELISTYASTEMATAFTECSHQCGGHHNPELIICEFLDEFDRPVKAGEAGELIITHLGVEGMLLLRFKTGDICRADYSPCHCGRKSMRITALVGRRSQMIKLKGTTFYPPALFDVLDRFKEISDYRIYVNREQDIDSVKIYIQALDRSFQDRVKEQFRATIRLVPDLFFCQDFPDHSASVLNRKQAKFIDLRTR